MGRLRMPAEYEAHEGTLIAWPCRDEIYPGALMAEAREAHARLAEAIARFEPVWVIADPADVEGAVTACGGFATVVELPIDDSWIRDSGPIYAFDGPERIALDFRFNGWGEKFSPWDRDDALARAWATAAGHALRPVPMVFEGGSITVDGMGTAATTTQCLLHPNRNPSMTQTEIEDQICDSLGLDAVVWLPYGLALDDDTDGHVDNVAAFARPGTLLLQGCDDPTEDDWVRMDVNRRVASGHPEMALDFNDAHGEQMRARVDSFSYLAYPPRLAASSNDPAMLTTSRSGVMCASLKARSVSTLTFASVSSSPKMGRPSGWSG